MRVQTRAKNQVCFFDGSEAGEGLAIFLGQQPTDTARYRFIVRADTNGQGSIVVGEFFSSPPTATSPAGNPTRMIAGAVCPGAVAWSVEVICSDPTPPDETAEVYLLSGKSCGGCPYGIKRVGERYLYLAGDQTAGTITFSIPSGRSLTSWSAIAGVVDGIVELNTGDLISVPAGSTVSGTPGAGFIGYTSITFTHVVFFAEFLESA